MLPVDFFKYYNNPRVVAEAAHQQVYVTECPQRFVSVAFREPAVLHAIIALIHTYPKRFAHVETFCVFPSSLCPSNKVLTAMCRSILAGWLYERLHEEVPT